MRSSDLVSPFETRGSSSADEDLSTDTFMSKTARQYIDSRSAPSAASSSSAGQQGGKNLDKINEDLQDVTRIMTKNMEDLLWRGDSLDRSSSPSRAWEIDIEVTE